MSLLSVFVLAELVWQIRSGMNLLPGALYLLVSGYPNLFSLALVANLRMKQRRGTPEPAAWAVQTRARVLLLVGWQLAILGSINMWPFGLPASRVSTIMGYLLAGAFMILSYKLVAIADSSRQAGGSRPISYFGRPRPRRLFFAGFVYTPIGFLILMSVEWSNAPWCPVILRPPRFLLLVVVLLSAAAAGLIFQRYRGTERGRSRAERVLTVVTLVVLGFAAASQIILGEDIYMYAFSSIAVVCIAATVYWLSLAEGAHRDTAAIPNNGEQPQTDATVDS